MKDVKVEVSEGSLGGTKYKHPTYGMIKVSRLVGNFKDALFGTETDHSSAMEITIGNCSLTQHLGRSWHYMEDTLTKVRLSATQYAEMISNPNTSGVPCTITYQKGEGRYKYVPHTTQIEYALEEVKGLADGMLDNTRSVQKEATELLSKKGTLKKAEKEHLIKLINSMTRELHDGLPFYTEQIKKHGERMVMEAKTDAEAMVTAIQTKVGSEILKDPQKIKLLLDIKD